MRINFQVVRIQASYIHSLNGELILWWKGDNVSGLQQLYPCRAKVREDIRFSYQMDMPFYQDLLLPSTHNDIPHGSHHFKMMNQEESLVLKLVEILGIGGIKVSSETKKLTWSIRLLEWLV